jgi:hypothetical protein
MNRTDELTDRLIDGTLTDEEAVELESLVAADPTAQTRHLAAVRVELVLRGLRTEFDLAGPTVAQIEADRMERTTAAVMSTLAHRPARGSSQFTPFVRAGAVIASLAAVVLIAIWFGTSSPGPQPPVQPSTEFARLSFVVGAVEVVGPAGAGTVRPELPLSADQTLRTVGEESVAVVAFPDGTRVEIHPESVVRFGPMPSGDAARKVVLVEGRVTANAAGGRVVVAAGETAVEASRGSFSLCTSGSGAARVETADGDVRVTHGTPAEPMVLGPGRAAFVRDEQTPVRVDAPWKLSADPVGRLDFQALDVGFDADGAVVAVSAKQWVRWTPGTPDPGRTLFPPKVFNDGLASWLTPDRRAVALCRIDDREERVVVRDLPSGAVRGQVSVRVSEPRFLCVAPDASWVATVGPKPNNRRVRVWDVAAGEERFACDVETAVSCLSVSPTGEVLAVGLSDSVAVFDPVGGKKLFELPVRRKGLFTLAFSTDGKQLAAGFNGTLQVWDVPGRKLVRTLDGFERVVTRAAFSPDGDLLAAGTQDGQVWVWATANGTRTQVIETGTRGVRALAFSPDGKRLVTATNKAPVAVWEVSPNRATSPGS